MRHLVPIIILSLALAVAPAMFAQVTPYGSIPGVATAHSYELTNPKCTDSSGNNNTPITVSLGAAGATTATYYSPDVPISPGITSGFINIKCTDASANPTLTVFVRYSASASNTTTPSDVTSGSYTTSFNVNGTSPYHTCTPIKLMPNAKTLSVGIKNLDSHVTTIQWAPISL